MKIKLIIFILFCLNTTISFTQDYENILLSDIINNAEQYNNKEITLKLRLKNIDNIFNKIVFYDRKNFDVIFDISEIKKTRHFKNQALNIREGLEYLVKFIIKDIIKETGFISGELIDFQPEILFKLPEGQKNQKAE